MHPRGLAAAKRWLNIALSDRSRDQSARARTETVLTMLANGNVRTHRPKGTLFPGGQSREKIFAKEQTDLDCLRNVASRRGHRKRIQKGWFCR